MDAGEMTNEELRITIARAKGLEVIENVPAYRDPECGGWQIPYDGDADHVQPAYVHCCFCKGEPRLSGDVEYNGHLACCLEVLPDWPSDIALAWELLEDLIAKGYRGDILTLPDGTWAANFLLTGKPVISIGFGTAAPEAICRAWLNVQSLDI